MRRVAAVLLLLVLLMHWHGKRGRVWVFSAARHGAVPPAMGAAILWASVTYGRIIVGTVGLAMGRQGAMSTAMRLVRVKKKRGKEEEEEKTRDGGRSAEASAPS